MTRHSEVCDWLIRFQKKGNDSSMSLGAWAGSIQSLILRHKESQPQPLEEIERLRSVLNQIASMPERYVTSSGERIGPEWVLHDVKRMAMEAIFLRGESKPQ